MAPELTFLPQRELCWQLSSDRKCNQNSTKSHWVVSRPPYKSNIAKLNCANLFKTFPAMIDISWDNFAHISYLSAGVLFVKSYTHSQSQWSMYVCGPDSSTNTLSVYTSAKVGRDHCLLATLLIPADCCGCVFGREGSGKDSVKSEPLHVNSQTDKALETQVQIIS